MEGTSYIKHISSEDIRALESKALSHSEVFHISCSGETSWFGFAKKILKLSSLSKNTELVPIPTTQYPTPAIRPQKSLLSNKKLKHSFNYEISHWQDALQKCLAGASN